jgi:Cytochrome b5-like Heme/Steroid binding domain
MADIVHTVYQLSSFANDHPGGVEILTESAGTDASESYDYAGHSEGAKDTLEKYLVGTLEGAQGLPAQKGSAKVTITTSAVADKVGGSGSQRFPKLWMSGLLICSVVALAMFRKEVLQLTASISVPHTTVPHFWIGGLLVVVVVSLGVAMVHQEFAKTLEHTKEPFAYPAVIPRAVRLS